MWFHSKTNKIFKLHSDIRFYFKNVSFPPKLTNDVLAYVGVFPITQVQKPHHDHTKNVTEGTPAFKEEKWMQVYLVTDASEEEIAERINQQKIAVRDQRNQLLSDCDWTQVLDAPVDQAAWATYRQALRDLPEQAGFPWEVVYPEAP